MAQRGRPRGFDREDALKRAMLLFWSQGYCTTSISELCSTMKIGSPSLYAAFGSKEELFCETLNLYRQVIIPEIWNVLEESTTARDGVAALLLNSADLLLKPSRPKGCMLTLCSVPENPDGAGSRLLRVNARLSRQRILHRLKQGAVNGEIADDIDLAKMAQFYQTVLQGMSIQARDGEPRKRLIETAHVAMAAWNVIAR